MDKKYMMPEDRSLLEKAKELRSHMTQEERKLWYLFLRKHRFRFYRQKIIGHYICDFYCPQTRLVIELDGSQHYTEKELAYVLINWDEIKANVRRVCDGLMDAFADLFQSLADLFRRNGGAE